MQDTHFIPEIESFIETSVFLTLFLQIREVFAFYSTMNLSLKFIEKERIVNEIYKH